MRKIAHLSDLHFCETDPAALAGLTATLRTVRPDLLVVSGDLTQRAREREFAAARAYLDALPFPRLVVPGNHDVPLYNIFLRTFAPLDRYRKYFGDDLAPFHGDDEIAIAGVNTARSLTFKDGRINREQVAHTCHRLGSARDDAIRIIVTHHPFEFSGAPDHKLVGRARMAIEAFAKCRVDLILSGHLHASQAELSSARYKLEGYSALLIQAGTATSVRRRGEQNSFNLIHTDRTRLVVERWTWDEPAKAFAPSATERFARKSAGEWTEIEQAGVP
jgi:3',5'-cyclic AMP phosphodiesterase CpdA